MKFFSNSNKMQLDSSVVISASILLSSFYLGACYLCGQLFVSSATTKDIFFKFIYFGMGLFVGGSILTFCGGFLEILQGLEKQA
jgi:hypothetical protein